MSEIQDLQEEIRLLKEREASLQRQLMLERERRLHAERIIENEKNACLELKSLLEQQDKKFRATIALPPTQFTNYFVRDSKLTSSFLCSCHPWILHTHTQTHAHMYTCMAYVYTRVHGCRVHAVHAECIHTSACTHECKLNLITVSMFT